MPHVHVEDFNPKEETTCVVDAIILKVDCLKRFLLVPLLSILTILIFPICLYWYCDWRKKYLYSEAGSLKEATHIYIVGKDGNKEIVPIKDYTQQSQ